MEITSSESAFPAISQNNFVNVTMFKFPDDTHADMSEKLVNTGIHLAVNTHF